MNQVDCEGAELRRQHAVERRRRAAPLQVAEYDAAGFTPQTRLDFRSHDVADAAERHLAILGAAFACDHRTVGQVRSFGDDHEREVLALLFPFNDLLADSFEIPWNFREQDHIAAAAIPACSAIPAGMASHDFEHHHAVVRAAAVVCSRSKASVAQATALSKPNV